MTKKPTYEELLKTVNDLEKRIEPFYSIIDKSPDLFYRTNLQGQISFVSPSVYRLSGYTGEEATGMLIAKEIFHFPDQWKAFWTRLEQEGEIVNFEARLNRKDQSTWWASTSAHFYKDQDENILGVEGVIRDITDRKRIDNELNAYRLRLEALVKQRTTALEAKNKELETFTYSVSHDLKAPLRGIDGYSRLLTEEHSDKLDGEGLQFLKNIRQSAAQMNQLIEDLLTYSRMERRQIQPVSIRLGPLIDTMISQRARDIELKQISLSVDLPFQSLISDMETLRQVMGNFLDNAIKFLKKDVPSAVEIGGKEEKGSWTLWVKDNGIGFDDKYHDRIFTIFQRLHRAEDYPGTGVGLAIVRKAAERINATVWAESDVEKGAVFFITIPKQETVT